MFMRCDETIHSCFQGDKSSRLPLSECAPQPAARICALHSPPTPEAFEKTRVFHIHDSHRLITEAQPRHASQQLRPRLAAPPVPVPVRRLAHAAAVARAVAASARPEAEHSGGGGTAGGTTRLLAGVALLCCGPWYCCTLLLTSMARLMQACMLRPDVEQGRWAQSQQGMHQCIARHDGGARPSGYRTHTLP
jgi:hypothetical protein